MAEQPVAGALTTEPLGPIAELRKPWTELAQHSGNVFSTWEWATAWMGHLGKDERPAVLGCRDPDGRLVAILPLCVDYERPLKVVRLIGHGPADELGPICAREHMSAAVEALVGRLAERSERSTVFLAERLSDSYDWHRTLRGVELGREPSPIVEVAGQDWDGYLAARSSNFRSQVRRKERKLIREHGLAYRLCDDPDRLVDDMRSLFALHRSRWGPGGSDVFTGPLGEFHQEFAALALERGWLRLWLAEADGRPVAGWYGFRYGGDEWFYQSGRDPEWEERSVGSVLLAHTLREAIGDGVARYRLLRGGESYKDRFKTGGGDVVTLVRARGPVGRVVTGASRAALRLPPPFKRLVTARVG